MKWITVAIYCSYTLVSKKMLMARQIVNRFPHITDLIDKGRINANERFIFYNSTEEIRTFHRLTFNDSIMIRIENSRFNSSKSDKNQSSATFYFLDKEEYEIVRFVFYPGSSEIKLKCVSHQYESIHMWQSPQYMQPYYEFILLFLRYSIIVFHKKRPYLASGRCTSRIPDITKFKHSSVSMYGLATMVEVRPESARVPGNWHIIKPIPINHKIIIRYYQYIFWSVITIRLTDKNEITALTVTIVHISGTLYARRVRLDNQNIRCAAFARTSVIRYAHIRQVEISVFPHQYKIAMRNPKGDHYVVEECIIYGHHLSPYDIQQAIFDATSNKTVFYAYYIEPV
uniref:Uncharacterized protein n=2 Tax=Wuchereria bancrofti TaxID=6293 RepID=A0AAF5PS73_WUCBA